MPLNYTQYLKIDELLALQIPESTPTYQEWLNGAASYVMVQINMTVHEPDILSLRLSTTEKVLSEEILRVVSKGEEI